MLFNPWAECRRLRQIAWSQAKDAEYFAVQLKRLNRALRAIEHCDDAHLAKIMARMALEGDWQGE